MSKNKMSKKQRQEQERVMAVNRRTMGIASAGAFVFSVLGIVCYFSDLQNIALICASFTLLNALLQILVSGQRDFGFELVFIVVGALVARIAKLDMLYTIVIAICIGDALLQTVSWYSARALRRIKAAKKQ